MHPPGRDALSSISIDPSKALLLLELRKRRMLQARMACSMGVSEPAVSRVLVRAGLSELSDLQLAESIVHYEYEATGDLLHVDTKKFGSIVLPSHRVTANRRDCVGGTGWEASLVTIDDHARLAFTARRKSKPNRAPCPCYALGTVEGDGHRIHRAALHRLRPCV